MSNNLIMSNKRDEAKLVVSLLMTTVMLGFGIAQIILGVMNEAYGSIFVGAIASVTAICLYGTAYYIVRRNRLTETEDEDVKVSFGV